MTSAWRGGEQEVPWVQETDNLEDDKLKHAATQGECGAEEKLNDWVLGLIVLEQLFSIEQQTEAKVGPMQDNQQDRLLQHLLHLFARVVQVRFFLWFPCFLIFLHEENAT
jgi:hypothetical protein